MPTFAEKMAKVFGGTLPPGWVQLVTHDLATYKGRFVTDLPGWSADAKHALKFDDRRLLDPEDLIVDAEPEVLARYLPLALIDGGPELLVLDRTTDEVRMWEHETGAFEPIVPSLAAFLASLKDGKTLKSEAAARKKTFLQACKGAKKLLPAIAQLQEAGDHAAVVQLAGPAVDGVELVRFEGPDGIDECTALSTAIDALGRATWHLGRREEASATFDRAYRCGGRQRDTTWIHALYSQLAVGRVAEARALEDYARALSYMLDDADPRDLAVALGQLGFTDADWADFDARLAAEPRDRFSDRVTTLTARIRKP